MQERYPYYKTCYYILQTLDIYLEVSTIWSNVENILGARMLNWLQLSILLHLHVEVQGY